MYACRFFFSSTRRHTRSLRDWSSDVCSSDLGNCGVWCARVYRLLRPLLFLLPPEAAHAVAGAPLWAWSRLARKPRAREEIGRASCRERVEVWGGGGGVGEKGVSTPGLHLAPV